MRRTIPMYGALLVAAPLVGVMVSRVATPVDGGMSGDSAPEVRQCVTPVVPFSPLRQTSIVRKPKEPKQYTASWRTSRHRGLGNLVTTLYTVHLHEAVPILGGQLPPSSVLDHFFRCRGFGTTHPLDPRLTEAVVAAAAHFQADRVEVISAYRSPKFNDALSKKGRHVAAESKHTKGMAMDIRVVGTPARDVGKWMFENFEGGVGTYVSDDFVHVDTGAKRRWRGR